jgi:hypothetical protein
MNLLKNRVISNITYVPQYRMYQVRNSQQPENCENRNDPDLVQAFLKKWWLESDLKRQTSRFHYGSKVPAVTITVFITILRNVIFI